MQDAPSRPFEDLDLERDVTVADEHVERFPRCAEKLDQLLVLQHVCRRVVHFQDNVVHADACVICRAVWRDLRGHVARSVQNPREQCDVVVEWYT